MTGAGGRNAARKPFMNQEYTDYLKSEKWKRRRAAYFMRHAKICRVCRSNVRIQLHHMDYARLGKESDSDMVALCEKHHKRIKVAQRMSRGLTLRQVTMLYINNANYRKRVDNAAKGRTP